MQAETIAVLLAKGAKVNVADGGGETGQGNCSQFVVVCSSRAASARSARPGGAASAHRASTGIPASGGQGGAGSGGRRGREGVGEQVIALARWEKRRV